MSAKYSRTSTYWILIQLILDLTDVIRSWTRDGTIQKSAPWKMCVVGGKTGSAGGGKFLQIKHVTLVTVYLLA